MKQTILIIVIILAALAQTSTYAYYNLATRQEEFIMISDKKEVSMGKSIAEAVEKKYKIASDPLVQKRVERIGKLLAKHCDRKTIQYHFKVLDIDEINAVALPGGYIYVFKGLMDKIKADDEIAAVLAHEIGHITARHAIKRLQASFGYSALMALMGLSGVDEGTAVRTNEALNQLVMSYSREDEIMADKLGVKYMRAAGFNSKGMVDFLKLLQEDQKKAPIRRKMDYRSHPFLAERISLVNGEIGKREFSDYINKPIPEPR